MPPARTGGRRQIGVDVEKAGARNVSGAVEITTTSRLAELPATVDELVAQAYQLPLEGGNGTEAGWIR